MSFAAQSNTMVQSGEPRESFLSKKRIPANERLIFALDVPSSDRARSLVDHLGSAVTFYKLGLELFMAEGYFELVEWLRKGDKKVFVDLKFFDIPETVAGAVRQLAKRDATFASVHGNNAMLEAACREKARLKILAVTTLTSLDNEDMRDLGFQVSIEQVVLSRAKRALAIGCDGVISSGVEAASLRRDLGDKFLIVVPGIRPGANREDDDRKRTDDQRRTRDVEDAFRDGADYIVVGRPIRDAADPRQAAEDIQARIHRLFGG